MLTDETIPTTLPERDKERDYELEQWIELATLLRQLEDIEPTDDERHSHLPEMTRY